ncbi:hypothetical protein BSNK01_08730 [Bacillaceae bacterium]
MEAVHGIVLAGGMSRRMGVRKELLPLRGKPLLLHLVAELERIGVPVTVVTNRREAYPFLPSHVGVTVDAYPGCGPVAGIHAGMLARKAGCHLVVACDYPLMRGEIFMEMISLLAGDDRLDGVVPYTQGKRHPLCAVYRERTFGEWESALREQRYRVKDVLCRLSLLPYEPEPGTAVRFMNMNTPDDYMRVLKEVTERDDGEGFAF